MKRMSLVALATVMTFGALKAEDAVATPAVTTAAEVAPASTPAPAASTEAKITPVAAEVKSGMFANAWGSVKGGVSTVYNTTKAGVYVPFTKNNANWANFGKTAAVGLGLYVGYKVYKAICDENKCCVSNRK